MKRILKCAVSLGVFAVSAVWAFLFRLVGKTPKGSCVVVYYHSVPEEQRQKFAAQLDILLRHADPIDISGDVSLRPGFRHVAVTFDDGFENFADHALPELEKRRIPVIVFVIADAIGKAFGPAGHSERVMSLNRIRSLRTDLVTIGSHTNTHPMLPSIGDDEARWEIVGSRAKLESVLERSIRLFSFPFGGFNARLIEICVEAGYQRVFTTLPEFSFGNTGQFVVGRVRVDPADWPLEFRLKVAGAYRWLPAAFALKRNVAATSLARKMLELTRPSHKSATELSSIHE